MNILKTKTKKLCIKKCKNCKGERCPNYFGNIHNIKKSEYFNGVLHSRRILFSDDILELEQGRYRPLDKTDKFLIWSSIILTITLLLFGGLV